MNEVCQRLNITYETLKYYCKEGLVPNVKRDKNNYREFSEKNIFWIEGICNLRKCGMSIQDIKKYMSYCLEGKDSIPNRQKMLSDTKHILLERINEMQESISYIDNKQTFYEDVLSGKTEYTSHLIDINNNDH